jgi:hypothetical protein
MPTVGEVREFNIRLGDLADRDHKLKVGLKKLHNDILERQGGGRVPSIETRLDPELANLFRKCRQLAGTTEED